jgi:hypothetical protein
MTTVEGEVSSLKTAVGKKADTSYVNEQNAAQDAAIAKNAKDIKNLPAGESLQWWAPWWLIVILGALGLIGAILGALAFFRKQPTPTAVDTSSFVTTADLDVVKEEIADVREQGGFKVIMLENDWYEQAKQLAEGQERGLQVLFDTKPSYTILVQRGSGDTAFIKAGITGQVPTNAVGIGNLQQIVRRAAKSDNFRLSNQIGLAVAA